MRSTHPPPTQCKNGASVVLAAAVALCRAGGPELRNKVRLLLLDPAADVRLYTALSLLQFGEKAPVPIEPHIQNFLDCVKSRMEPNCPVYVAAQDPKGLTARQVIGRHALRNALTPIVTLLGLSLPALFSGAVFIEAVFAWPGVGRVLVEAVQARDYPVVMAATAVSAVLVVAGNLLADILAAWLDPRVRSAAA